jgi:hypothetical protein
MAKSSTELEILIFWATLIAHIEPPKTIKTLAQNGETNPEKESEVTDRRLTGK